MDAPESRLYSASELAEELGLTARALRFYESKGLPNPRRAGARRVYAHRDRARLKLIVRGKRLGFSLADIREYLELYDADTTQIGQLRQLHAAVTRRIDDLEQQRAALEHTLEELNLIRAEAHEALKCRDPGSVARAGVAPPTTPASLTSGEDSP